MISKQLLLISALLALSSLPRSVHGQCSASTGGCSDCLSDSSCTWFEDIQFCEDGCGMDGCGASACAEDIDTCQECLATVQHKQYAWSPDTNECLVSCNFAPADASCFSGKNYGPEVCEPTSCEEATNCADCTSFSGATCGWFEDIKFCQDESSGCGMEGCGASGCPADLDTCKDCLGQSQHGQHAWSPDTDECVASCDDAPADAGCFPGKTYGPEVCDCGEFTSCNECVGIDKCAWSVDSCLDSCNDAPADAACFPGSDYEPDVCPASEPVTTSASSCEEATNCADCTAVAGATCGWFEDIKYCQDESSACGMEGCGASACPADLDTCQDCLGQSQHGQHAWSPDTNECVASCDDAPADAACFPGKSYGPEDCESSCGDAASCTDCVNNDTCAWSVDSCFDSCADAPADAACFPGASYTPDDACPSDPPPPPSGCEDATNCADCTAVAGATCGWFEDIKYCQDESSACGMEGCGASACPADLDTCQDCLGQSQHGQHAWSPDTNECVASCDDAPADAACFPGKSYGPEDCESSCGDATSCTDCVNNDNCAWSVDSCLDSCDDAPADAACFPGSDYEPVDACSSAPPPPPGEPVAQEPTTSSSGKISTSFAVMMVLIGLVFSMD